MGTKYKIAVIISFILALFYALPWLALNEQFRLAGYNKMNLPPVTRVLHLFCTVFCTALVYFQYNLFSKDRFTITKGIARIALDLSVNLFLTVILSIASVFVARWLFTIGAPNAYFTFYFFRNASICIVIILIAYTIKLMHRLQQEKIEVLMLKQQNAETELSALRSQVDSHFLFNTLTTLSSLVRQNNSQAVTFVDHLAGSFRYTLEKREHKLVTVDEELHFMESYIFMMKHRFNEGLSVTVNVDPSLRRRNIPQFSLQIAVENAIKHNIITTKQVLGVEIVSIGNSIIVRNNLQRKPWTTGHGIGLKNLSQRYHLIARKNISVKQDEKSFELHLPIL